MNLIDAPYMVLVIFLIAMLPFLFAFIMCSLRQMHMFQLNSYSGVKHMRWMRKNFSYVITNLLSAILFIMLIVNWPYSIFVF